MANEPTAEEGQSSNGAFLFAEMARRPYPLLVAIPFLFSLLICLGLSRPNLIEDEISNSWIPTDGTYKKDKEYAQSVGANTQDELSTFAAMALSRHGDNLFTEDNLNAIVERMQLIETTPVSLPRVIRYSPVPFTQLTRPWLGFRLSTTESTTHGMTFA